MEAAAARATVMEAMVTKVAEAMVTKVAEAKPEADGYWNTVTVIRV